MYSDWSVVQIPKRRGGYRRIYIVPVVQRERARWKLASLHRLAESVDTYDVAHGFRRGRSPVTNAVAHTGQFEFTLSWDLQDFFDNITTKKLRKLFVRGMITEQQCRQLESYLVDGAARQGLPTSPIVANIVASQLDAAIVQRLQQDIGRGYFAYTRYADDLTISVYAGEDMRTVRRIIPDIVAEEGFTLAKGKHRIQWARCGRRIITGISAGPRFGDIKLPRRLRRKIRAIAHQRRIGRRRGGARASGYISWAAFVQSRCRAGS